MSGRRRSELLEHHADLQAGEVGAEAEVRAAAAEGDVLVRRAPDVEAERVVEHVLVAVGRDVEDDDLVAFGDAPGRGSRCRAVAVRRKCMHRRRPAEHLLDGDGHERRVGAAAGPAGRGGPCSASMPWAMRLRVGLVAGHREQQEEEVELELAEPLAVDLGLEERGDDVVVAGWPRFSAASSLA